MSGPSIKARERLLYLISPIALLAIWQALLMFGFGDRRFIPTRAEPLSCAVTSRTIIPRRRESARWRRGSRASPPHFSSDRSGRNSAAATRNY